MGAEAHFRTWRQGLPQAIGCEGGVDCAGRTLSHSIVLFVRPWLSPCVHRLQGAQKIEKASLHSSVICCANSGCAATCVSLSVVLYIQASGCPED